MKKIVGKKLSEDVSSNEGIKSFLERFKSFVGEHCIVYFKKNPMLFYFMATALFNTLLLRILTVGNFLYLKPLFADLAMLFIFASFMFLFKKDKKRRKYLVVLSFITTIICIIHSVYYTYYASFASISLLSTATFVVEVGDAVVEQALDFTDFLYLWQPIFMLSFYFRDKKKVSDNEKLKIENDAKVVASKKKRLLLI